MHLGVVAALFMFTWEALLAALILYWVGVELGNLMCDAFLMAYPLLGCQ